jgi:hypothetical protein
MTEILRLLTFYIFVFSGLPGKSYGEVANLVQLGHQPFTVTMAANRNIHEDPKYVSWLESPTEDDREVFDYNVVNIFKNFSKIILFDIFLCDKI